MKKLAIITRDTSFFGQTRKPWVTADIDKIKSYLYDYGYVIEQHIYHEIINKNVNLSNIPILYTFSQKTNIRQYFFDVIKFLYDEGYNLIPEIDLLICHENKGYQEICKKKRGIKSLNSYYFSSREDLEGYDIKYPTVLKTLDGSNGTGVFLIKSQEELIKVLKNWEKLSVWEHADLLRRMHLRKKKYKEYPNHDDKCDCIAYKKHITPERNFILQPFVPNLQYDFRVLVLYNHLWVTRRWNRDNDFRASGAKKFDCDFQAPSELLDFAIAIFNKFKTPSLSIDIAFDGKDYHLIEFQAQHFGINVIVKNKGYYQKIDDKWLFKEVKPNFELEMAHCVAKYLDNQR